MKLKLHFRVNTVDLPVCNTSVFNQLKEINAVNSSDQLRAWVNSGQVLNWSAFQQSTLGYCYQRWSFK